MTTRETSEVPAALPAALRKGSRYLLTSHVNPDGDAIGSELGLAQVLKSIGKETVIWNRDSTPGAYLPLIGSEHIHVGLEPPAGFPEAFDAAIALECPSLDRCGLADFMTELPLINIDHHLGNDEYGEVLWIDTTAPAVGAMIMRLAEAMEIEVSADTANALFLALVTDTGGFRFSNAGVPAFEAAAAMVRAGARPEQVSQWLYESTPEAAIRLRAEVLQTLELHHDGAVATIWMTPDMLSKVGAEPGDAEGLIDAPRSIAGVQTVALFKQLADGNVKISLRSRGEISIETIARKLGGGGHRNAAGVTVHRPQDKPIDRADLQRRIVAAMAQAIADAADSA